ncbi:D-2-hydroxyacid dehydrogenase [Mesorhizobium sp. M3A.F.Ca.ET.201.01.1.1]|uniref:D-2-hydroxyacid dehydrogenase n=1 Tax=Mesorhizobium sp. M3A.F.Ca.ET.201.01.1.1 TaxID=2563946 RepID=UPI00109412D4|nr:D-2-hydroxyacid dehydrogenase [Mesorhizobium sp. M3A.F.Ca.ET.201.01.1.1]TGS65587.1 D-2-hydroxyacid dehydrogenase [Mesorhizobium sp. M3A.F.Ca.ET.201.01.1.1]
MTTQIVFLDRETLPPATVIRPPSFSHELHTYGRTEPSETASRIKEADIVITNKVRIGAEEIAASPNLKLIAVAATGTDVIDIAAAKVRGITVSNIRGYAINTVPEHTFALIMALRRSIVTYRESVIRGRWLEAQQFCYFDYPIFDLANSTLGIIGDGVLGKSVAKIADAFGMKVLFSDYKGTTGMGPLYTPFEKVLRQSDIITIHTPLLPTTYNLISTAEFAMMDRKPLLINTARGGIVDEKALVQAVKSEQVSGVGFDVVTVEPLPHDHVFNEIISMPNVILTPHVAWASAEATQGLADDLVDNIDAFMAQRPRNVL